MVSHYAPMPRSQHTSAQNPVQLIRKNATVPCSCIFCKRRPETPVSSSAMAHRKYGSKAVGCCIHHKCCTLTFKPKQTCLPKDNPLNKGLMIVYNLNLILHTKMQTYKELIMVYSNACDRRTEQCRGK